MTAFDSEKYTHESDRAALKALKAIPGFSTLLKAFMGIWNERQQKILNMSSRIKIGPNQMKKYHDMLPPICEKLGIEVPELYLEMNVVPNAYTSGDNNPFIVMTSGLLKTLPEELIPTILAHECGHIACHHVLYLTMGRMVLQGAGNILASALPVGTLLTVPLQLAFYYWMRCSEFSADRVAVLCDGTDRKMEEVCLRMAGWDKEIDAEVSLEAFLDQAADYKDMISASKWNKTLESLILSQASHPLMAVRATECRNWFQSKEYQDAIGHLSVSGCRLEPPAFRIEPTGANKKTAETPKPQPAAITQKRNSAQPSTLIIPDGYTPLESKPNDPPRSTVYGYVNSQSNCILQVFPLTNGEVDFNEPKDALIHRIRDRLCDDEGIIQVERGTTASGAKYILSITKTKLEPRCTEYKVRMYLSAADDILAVQGFFMEVGSPGFREAAVKGRLTRELQGADVRTLWEQDPYDPQITSGFLMNESEKMKYDPRFPLHPLSEARKVIRTIIAQN